MITSDVTRPSLVIKVEIYNSPDSSQLLVASRTLPALAYYSYVPSELPSERVLSGVTNLNNG